MNALQQIAERHPEYHTRHQPAREQGVVPEGPPARIGNLVAEPEPDRTKDERSKNEKHGDVEARERGGIDRRPCREHRATTEDQPDLIAVPERSNRIDRNASLDVSTSDVGQQHRNSQIETM